MKNMDTTARATSIKDNSKGIGEFLVGVNFTVREIIILNEFVGGGGRH